MKASFNWLRELVALPADTTADLCADVLTRQGLEVEGLTSFGAGIDGVLVAEVLGVRPHPGADKLRIVRVRAGAREDDVVCGAPNVPPPGHRVVWAPPGASLPGGKRLEAKEVRGVLSPGMLCSEPELGLGPEGDGILILSTDVAHGADFATTVGVPDVVMEVNVTPNRPDALSHGGLARELAAGLGVSWRWPTLDVVPRHAGGAARDVAIADDEACPRYIARFLDGLTVAPSPIVMKLRLAACGVRSISNLVDVTNYVLLETGHPLHAFDADKIEGALVVRRARAGEPIRTLDGVDRALVESDIVIADARGPVALAGVMGGATSEVSAGTRRVVLEAATFHPASVRRTSKRLGLSSEASYRFERGVDASGLPLASERAATLMAKLGGGTLADAVVDKHPRPLAPRTVTLSMARLRRVSGSSFTSARVAAELGRLGFDTATTSDAVTATVPSFRPDVTIPEDLVEEILRVSGAYTTAPDVARVRTNARPLPNPEGPADRARALLAALGLSEAATWAFVPAPALTALAAAGPAPRLTNGVRVKNPISADYEVMRTSLLPGLAAAVARNLARGADAVALFEVGPVVRTVAAGEAPHEPIHAAGLMTGASAGWLKAGGAIDVHDAKLVVEELARGLGLEKLSFEPGAVGFPFLHPGVSAVMRVGTDVVGAVGDLHPRVARALGLNASHDVCYFELELAPVAAAVRAPRGHAPPRFPAVTRDVSFWIDRTISAADQRAALLSAHEPLLRDVAVLEDFRDVAHCPAGQKGMLWTLMYRADERTLTDADVDAAHARALAALGARFPIALR